MTLEEQLIRHEGLRLKPYRCSQNHWTIGVGHNLDMRPLPYPIPPEGITQQQAMELLRADIADVQKELNERVPQYFFLSDVRKRVLLDMAFNLGVSGLLKFVKMFEALVKRDYRQAAEEMRRSRWAGQVGERAERLSRWMETGEEL